MVIVEAKIIEISKKISKYPDSFENNTLEDHLRRIEDFVDAMNKRNKAPQHSDVK